MQEYKALQQKVIAKSSAFVGPSGTLFYATCSVLACENEGIVDAFLDAHTDFRLLRSNWRLPDADGDGFYFAILQRA
jgi:16S rRNA (cytosine967-C5)-methyltransferase